ncbi:LAME_0H10946g1_1 [Lachancea meyersii CBS 8951]|uniref:LAME_0H10946g1_1 n=1 Tax=Lachancea meyersii CBS 8951 TaxID=1266667 RepID=A0A1G4KG79_9SACH|nr:LAME_0H10946g1_1 [Lachancea meyersii CBS 8951]
MDIEQPTKQESPQPLDPDRIEISETIGGSQTRKYLNKHVTPALLRGMRLVAKNQPDDPLQFLGEYLIQQSQQTREGAVTDSETLPDAK